MLDMPEPPIVTDDAGDIAVYLTVADACADIEAVDVRGGAYEVFDSRGHRLRIAADGEAVSIRMDPGAQSEADELIRRLRRFIDRIGADRVGLPNFATASLTDLVDALEMFFHRD
jgi:hypothetical protein